MTIIFLSKTIPDNADMPCDRRFTNLETLKSDSWQKLRLHRIMIQIFQDENFQYTKFWKIYTWSLSIGRFWDKYVYQNIPTQS